MDSTTLILRFDRFERWHTDLDVHLIHDDPEGATVVQVAACRGSVHTVDARDTREERALTTRAPEARRDHERHRAVRSARSQLAR